MRIYLIIFCSLIIFQYCSTGRQDKPVNIEIFNLFPGKWVKSNDSIQFIQEWQFDEKDVLTGNSYRLAGNDTSDQMELMIDVKHKPITLIVQKAADRNINQYELKHATNKQVTFENPDILFPFLVIFKFSSNGILNWTRKGGSPDNERSLSFRYRRVSN